jgi:hypothetical protein
MPTKGLKVKGSMYTVAMEEYMELRKLLDDGKLNDACRWWQKYFGIKPEESLSCVEQVMQQIKSEEAVKNELAVSEILSCAKMAGVVYSGSPTNNHVMVATDSQLQDMARRINMLSLRRTQHVA